MRWRVSLLMFLVLPLTLVGCGGDDDGDGGMAPRLLLRPRVVLRISLLLFPLVSPQILPPALACPLARRFRCNLARLPVRLRLSR